MVRRMVPQFTAPARLSLGCVWGTALEMWLPVLCSFVLGFNKLSHILALILLLCLTVLCLFLTKHAKTAPVSWTHEDFLALVPVLTMTAFYYIVEANHIMAPAEDGGMIFGQSTYFDANIHLSFITTPVVQGEMPFVYNILPTMQVSYPFLSDTVSASVYLWGSSLRFAYILPTVMGAFTVFLGAWCFFRQWLKTFAKAIIAWVLFFFNGGFGFAYFFDGLKTDTSNFSRIFTALYETPTNLNDKMIRWVNTFCDMMIPQRATLFGWMMLFAVLYLLYRAVFLKENKLFLYAGLLAGMTPLISTHIFLSLGLISVGWMMSRLVRMADMDETKVGQITWVLVILTVSVFLVSCLTSGTGLTSYDYDTAGRNVLLVTGGLIVLLYLFLIVKALINGHFQALLHTWGLFLGIVLLLALPQLVLFTFRQSSGNGFLTPHFNWVNWKDSYLWFYIKNVGLPVLLLIPAVLSADKRQKSILAPIALLVLLADTFALQPNTYDNNKLLYPAYVLAVGGVADYLVELYDRLKAMKGTKLLAVAVMVVCTLSGVLSMGREAVAGQYEIYSATQVKASWWIQENTPSDAMLVTNDRYNNAITSLTGRNVVCGSNSFFSTHGLPDFHKLQRVVSQMYSDPVGSKDLFEQYGVDYLVVGSDEKSSYDVDEAALATVATLVYDVDGVRIYQLNK